MDLLPFRIRAGYHSGFALELHAGEELMGKDERPYQTIVVPNRIAAKVVMSGGPGLEEIEASLAESIEQLAERYPALIRQSCARVRDLLQSVEGEIGAAGALDEVFRRFHDLKGQASTFGFPLIGEVSAMACDLFRAKPDAASPPLGVLRVCADAVDLMAVESIRDRSDPRGATLIENLETASSRILASWR